MKRNKDLQVEIEQFFKMPFGKIIKELHIKQSRSIHSIAKQAGMSHTPFVRIAKKNGIKLRDKHEASRLAISMKNPMKNSSLAIQRAEKMAIHYKKNPLPQEKQFIEILKSFNVEAIFQYPFDKYIIDFYIPSINLFIEIDSTHKWGHHRRFKNKEKDEFINSKGLKVLRITKHWVEEASNIFNILFADNVVR